MKTTAIILCLAGTAAQADISGTFRDGAPVDRFTFTANDGCLMGPANLTIDLSGSDAGLIFDVTGAGQGVEVFQPLVLVSGGQTVQSTSNLTDGDTMLALSLNGMPQGQPLAFTMDLDDTIGQREITVSGAEIAGATVTLAVGDQTATGTFDSRGNVTIVTADCGS